MKKILLAIIFITSLFASYEAPMNVNGAKTIDSRLAYDMYSKGVKFLDVRPIKFVKFGKIKGALHLYVDNFKKELLEQIVKKDEALVIYCNGRGCPLSSEAIVKLVQYGYTNLYYYRDGFPAWKYYKLPIQ